MIQNKFSGKLYTRRLEAYLEIFELVSGFIKIIKRKGILYEELKIFYEKYSALDSKSGLLFSYSVYSSSELMEEIKNILSCKKTMVASCEELKKNLLKKLAVVELTMKCELGVFEYTNPTKIMKKYKLPGTNREALAEMFKHG